LLLLEQLYPPLLAVEVTAVAVLVAVVLVVAAVVAPVK
jgi:hypothetical protein